MSATQEQYQTRRSREMAVQRMARSIVLSRARADRDLGSFTVTTAFALAEQFEAVSQERLAALRGEAQ